MTQNSVLENGIHRKSDELHVKIGEYFIIRKKAGQAYVVEILHDDDLFEGYAGEGVKFYDCSKSTWKEVKFAMKNMTPVEQNSFLEMLLSDEDAIQNGVNAGLYDNAVCNLRHCVDERIQDIPYDVYDSGYDITAKIFDLFYYQNRIDKKKKLEFGDTDVRSWFEIIKSENESIQDVMLAALKDLKEETKKYRPAFVDMINAKLVFGDIVSFL